MLVRLLGFVALGCGCVVGRYRELSSNREVTYIEEKGTRCETGRHRRNHTVSPHGHAAIPMPLGRVA
jgi:hypothetical protein